LSECWTKTPNVRGFDPIAVYETNAKRCADACNKQSGCVAIDYNIYGLGRDRCHLLTSTETMPSGDTGVTVHYERIPGCADNNYWFPGPSNIIVI